MSISKDAKMYRNHPLNPGRNPIKLHGRHFTLVSSPVPLGVKLGDMPENDLVSGQRLALDAPDEFDRVELVNPTAEMIRADFWIGHIAFYDDRRDNIESPTQAVAWAGTEIPATDEVAFPPLLVAGRIRRKAIVVSNRDPALNLEITDADGNIVCRVGPEESIMLPLSEACSVKNENGAPVACNVGEIYWLR